MIFDTLENLSKYEAVLSGVKEAVRVLKETDLKSLEKGSYETQNKCCKYNINEYTSANDKRFEIHKKAVDIQIVLSGTEKMEYLPRSFASRAGEYDEKKDVAFFEASGSLSFTAEPGFFVIFFPGEPHRPGLCAQNPEKIKKVIFKITAE